MAGINYSAAIDMRDGSNDDATLAIGHLDQEKRVVVDLVMNQQCKVPFNPPAPVKLFADTVKTYRGSRVTLDRFAHNTFSAAFAQHGVSAVLSDLTTHQTYEAFGPRLNSGQVVLLDHSECRVTF